MICLAVLTARLSPLDLDGRHHLISCNTVAVSLYAIYMIFSATLPIVLDDFNFTWVPQVQSDELIFKSLLIALYGGGVYYFGYRYFVALREPSEPRPGFEALRQPVLLAESRVQLTCLIALVVGISLKLYVIASFGGISGAITQMSGGLREALGIDATEAAIGVVRSWATCADFAASLLVLLAVRRGKAVWFYCAILFFTLSLTYLTAGKRTTLVEYLMLAVVGFSVLRRPIKIGALPIWLACGVGFGWVTLMIRSIYAAELNGVAIDVDSVPWSHGSLFGIYFFSLEYAFFETLSLCVERSDQILDLFGGALPAFWVTQIQPIFLIIPRAIWSGKPSDFYDLSHGISAVMFDLPLTDVPAGIAPSYIGTSWVLGGAVGVTFYGLLLAYCAARWDRWFWRGGSITDPVRICLYAILLFAIFVLWRQGGLGFSVISLVTSQLGHLLTFALVFFGSRAKRQ